MQLVLQGKSRVTAKRSCFRNTFTQRHSSLTVPGLGEQLKASECKEKYDLKMGREQDPPQMLQGLVQNGKADPFLPKKIKNFPLMTHC